MSTALSILVCVHNKAELTRPFLDSLFESIDPLDHISTEVLIYDDHSTDDTPQLLKRYGNRLRVYQADTPGSFGHNMNHLAERASGSQLVLLNNDMLLLQGWLEPMLSTAKQHNAGIVGNLQLYPESNNINHAGGAYAHDLTPTNLYDGLPQDLPAAHLTRQMRFVTAACWLADPALYKDLNGFDSVFRNGYEDADFCLRAIAAGSTAWYCGQSMIYHYGSSSPKRFKHQAKNRAAFLRRWKGSLTPDLKDWTTTDGVDWPNDRPIVNLARSITRLPGCSTIAGHVSAIPAVQAAWRKLKNQK